MHTALHIFAILALTAFSTPAAPGAEKAAATKLLISVLSDIETLAARQLSHYPTGQVARRIDTLVERVTATDDLMRLALTCHAIAWPQAAEHTAHDGVFDYAMWQSVRRIARTPGQEAASALQRLRPIIGPDAGNALTMRELISAQARVTERQ